MPIDFNDGDGIQALDQNEHSDRWQYSVKSGVDVSPGTNDLTVQCSSGEVIFDGTNVSVAAQDNVALDPADDTQPRKDVVYVDANGALKVATGTPEAAVPSGETRFQTQRPAPNDLSGTDAVVVAEVWVAAGVSDIAAADVRDRRQFADLAARSVSTESLSYDMEEGTDVSSSRSFDTVYQNSNDHTIKVAVRAQIDPGSGSQSLTAFIDVAPSSPPGVDDRTDGIQMTNYDDTFQYVLNANVPPGHYYEVKSFKDESIISWIERGLTE